MALGLKHDDLVDVADHELERGCLRRERHAAALCAVHAAEVHREVLVDEDPDVVVTREAQDLGALVFEPVPDLAREVEVVRVALVAEALAVDREEVAVRVAELAGHQLRERERLQDR